MLFVATPMLFIKEWCAAHSLSKQLLKVKNYDDVR